MQKWKKMVATICVMVLWLVLMWKLSSVDGTETLRDSMWLAQKIGNFFYDSPTVIQLQQLNLLLRKLAHIFLYAVFGGISSFFWHFLLEKYRMWVQLFPALFSCAAVGFLDELHKIPISGRHFSFSESCLNAGSAVTVIVVLYFFFWFFSRKSRRKMNKKSC